jgi:FixJ family two-component response regulator
VAIVIQRTFGEQAAPLRLATYGLTDREREIATLVARGVNTQALAKRLVLAPWTVQDQLEADLPQDRHVQPPRAPRTQILIEEYLPAFVTRAPLDADGALVRRGHG